MRPSAPGTRLAPMSEAEHSAGRPAWRRYARSSVLLLVTVVSLYLLLPSLLAVFGSWRALAHLEWPWAVLALAGEAASFACIWWLDRIALRTSDWFSVAAAQLSGNA